jgi:hypothetical protein
LPKTANFVDVDNFIFFNKENNFLVQKAFKFHFFKIILWNYQKKASFLMQSV